MGDEKRYKKLFVWQKAHELAHQVYIETKKFPKEELYGMTSQIRRSSLSVPLNIVEGHARSGTKTLKQFCSIALGSLCETEYLLEFAAKLGYLDISTFEKLEKLRRETGCLLWKFFQSL